MAGAFTPRLVEVAIEVELLVLGRTMEVAGRLDPDAVAEVSGAANAAPISVFERINAVLDVWSSVRSFWLRQTLSRRCG